MVVGALGALPEIWLLCIDAADGSDVLGLLAEVYLPADLTSGHVILTSRRSDSRYFSRLGASHSVMLQMMSPEDAMAFLFRTANGLFTADVDDAQGHAQVAALPPSERSALAERVGHGIKLDTAPAPALP